MGKPKRKRDSLETVLARPWCYYCERDFEDRKVLIDHQKLKHFGCAWCKRRLDTVGGLRTHTEHVHKQETLRVENTIPGREDAKTSPEIFADQGIPAHLNEARRQNILEAYYRKEADHRGKTGNPLSGSKLPESAVNKRPKLETKEELKEKMAIHRAKKQAEKAAAAAAAEAEKNPIIDAASAPSIVPENVTPIPDAIGQYGLSPAGYGPQYDGVPPPRGGQPYGGQPYGTQPPHYGTPAGAQGFSNSPHAYGGPAPPFAQPAYGGSPQQYGGPPTPYGVAPHASGPPQFYGYPPQSYGAQPPAPHLYGEMPPGGSAHGGQPHHPPTGHSVGPWQQSGGPPNHDPRQLPPNASGSRHASDQRDDGRRGKQSPDHGHARPSPELYGPNAYHEVPDSRDPRYAHLASRNGRRSALECHYPSRSDTHNSDQRCQNSIHYPLEKQPQASRKTPFGLPQRPSFDTPALSKGEMERMHGGGGESGMEHDSSVHQDPRSKPGLVSNQQTQIKSQASADPMAMPNDSTDVPRHHLDGPIEELVREATGRAVPSPQAMSEHGGDRVDPASAPEAQVSDCNARALKKGKQTKFPLRLKFSNNVTPPEELYAQSYHRTARRKTWRAFPEKE